MDLFEQIEEGGEFAEVANIPIPGGKVVNIAYLLILRTGEMKKSCEQCEDIQVWLKTWHVFKDHFTQAYRRYYISKKSTAAAHGYGASTNNTQESEAQVNTADALQALACAAMEDKEEMSNLMKHQPHIISEPNSITRDNYGAFQANADTTSPYKNKDTIHKENNTISKNQVY